MQITPLPPISGRRPGSILYPSTSVVIGRKGSVYYCGHGAMFLGQYLNTIGGQVSPAEQEAFMAFFLYTISKTQIHIHANTDINKPHLGNALRVLSYMRWINYLLCLPLTNIFCMYTDGFKFLLHCLLLKLLTTCISKPTTVTLFGRF